MMRILFALLLCLAMAGCADSAAPPGLQDDGRDEDPDSTPTPTPQTPPPTPTPLDQALLLDFDFSSCHGTESLAEIPPGVAAAAVPEGYTPFSGAGATGDQAIVQLFMVRCQTFATNVGDFNNTSLGWVAVRVEDPGLGAAGDEHWYRTRMLAEAGLMTQLWSAAPYDVHTGAFAQVVTADVQLPGLHTGQWTTSFGDYDTNLASTLELSDTPVTVVHYTEVEAGRLEWIGSLDATSFATAAGSLSAPGDEPASRLLADASIVTHRVLGQASLNGNNLWLRADA